MQISERSFSGDSYRYGYQGQEKDDEIKGAGSSINYSLRMYDTRLGRFMKIDPIAKKYPMYSPYHFSSNQPIHATEWEGAESSYDLTSRDIGLQKMFEQTATTLAEKEALTKMYNDAAYGWVGEVLSLDELSGVARGRDLKGNSYNRAAAAGILLIGFVPGGKMMKPVLKIAKATTKGMKVGNFASKTLLNEHFTKHAAEFAGKFKNAGEYAKGAQDFFKRQGDNIFEFNRKTKNGTELVKYDKANNLYGVMKEDGTIKTVFKPKDGAELFKGKLKSELGEDAVKAFESVSN
jgi:RHS repeat-associated protein